MLLSFFRSLYVPRLPYVQGFPGGSDSEESACNTGDLGSIPGSRKSPGGGNGNPLRCSCLENPTDRGAWWASVRGVTVRHNRATDAFKTFSLMEYLPHIVISNTHPITISCAGLLYSHVLLKDI